MSLAAYLPIDRYYALAQAATLADRTAGAALFADISGFTPLTETLANELGPRRGGEELSRHLNAVYDALIAQVNIYHGSVLSFSGDAITCWFDGSDSEAAHRAVTVAVAMQEAMDTQGVITTPMGQTLTLALKVAVVAGPVRRFVVGDPNVQYLDVLAGSLLDRLAGGEHLAKKGEIVVSAEVQELLGANLEALEWRESEENQKYFVVGGLKAKAAPDPWPELPDNVVNLEQLRPWLLNDVYERMMAGIGDFLTELRPVTVLFMRFTGLDYDQDAEAAQKLDAFVRWVQKKLSDYDSELANYEGRLLQITIGDKGSSLYASFGAPVAHQNDPVRAVRAGQSLLTPPPELSWVTGIQLGISTGTVRAGAYGSTVRHTYGILGDEVNLAARLMQAAEPWQMLVSERTKDEVGTRFVWDTLPPIRVKGKAEPINIFRLDELKERQYVRFSEPHYELPMVGREEEMAVIEQKIGQVLNGTGQIIGITAEAGMGKSRLVAEVIRTASSQQIEVFGGECQSYGTNSSYLVWENIWNSFFDLPEDAPVENQLRNLETRMAAINIALVARIPLLSVILNLPIPDNELTRSFDAKLRKASLEALLVDCVRARAKTSPIMLVIEDSQWIDPLSRDLLEAIGRATYDVPVLIVLAYRPPEIDNIEPPKITQFPNFSPIVLKDFTSEQAAKLIELKLGQLRNSSGEVSQTLVERITERAQGNPFYIEELLNYLRDRGLDTQDTEALEKLELPTSLHSLLLSRIDQLRESQKVTLKVASVIGRKFVMSWLWGVHPQLGDAPRVQSDLETLSRLYLTLPDQPEQEAAYLFKHIVTREVAYESLSFSTRAQLHGQLAEYIEQHYADELDQFVSLLAYHYSLSNNEVKKREYLYKAGEAARAAFSNTAAIDYYQRLLPLLPKIEQAPIMLNLAQVLELVGQWDEADGLYREALELAAQLEELQIQARAQSAMGGLLRRRGNYAEAIDWLTRAKQGFDLLQHSVGVCQTLEAIGEVYRLKGAYTEASEYYDESLRLADLVENPTQNMAIRAAALKGSGTLGIYQGNYRLSRFCYNESLTLLRELGDKPSTANVLSNLGVVARQESDYEGARKLAEEALAIRRELGDRLGIATSLGNLGMIAQNRQDYDQAISYYQDCLKFYRRLGERNSTAIALNNLGDVAADMGDYHTARAMYTESLEIQRELGGKWPLAYLLEAFGILAARQEQFERAILLVSAATTLRQAIGAKLSPSEKAKLDNLINPVREALGEERVTALDEEGKAMPLEYALDFALEVGVAV